MKLLTTDTFLKMMKAFDGRVTSQIIRDLILTNTNVSAEMSTNYERYKGRQLPIATRTFTDPNKINNRIGNDFRGEIVDQSVGYLFGKPATYTLDKARFGSDEVAYKTASAALQNFLRTNHIEDLDAETGKMASICGTASRLCYIDKNGLERVMNVNPWEVIYIYDRSLDEVQYAIRYYVMTEVGPKGQVSPKLRVEFYDSQNVTYWIRRAADEFVLDDTEAVNPQPHLFSKVPLIEFLNNEERIADFTKTEDLIDAYDRTLSDAQNEIEEFRQAYMVFEGVQVSKEMVIEARQSGAFSLPVNGKAAYLIKEINAEFLEAHKKTLRENICRFSSSVEMAAEKFSGSGASGEARKWQLLPLEQKVGIKERKFQKASSKMFEVISTAWEKKGIVIDWRDIKVSLDRNIPLEITTEAEAQSKLKGLISDRTRLEIFSPVRDVDAELATMKQEAEESVNLDTVPDDNTNE